MVHEEGHAVHGSVFLEIRSEKPRGLCIHAHGREDYAEIRLGVVQHPLALHQLRLSADLCADLVVTETCRGEQRDLLASGDRVHHVDRTDPRLDHLFGVHTHVGIDGLALDIDHLLGKHRGALVDRNAGAVEGPAQHLLGNRHVHCVASELAASQQGVDAGGALEDLHHCTLACDFQDLAAAHRTVTQVHVHNLCVFRKLHVLQDHQRTLHTDYGSVVYYGVYHVVAGRCQGIHSSCSHVSH